MKITQESDYALRVIAYLSKAEYGDIIEAQRIAETQAIPLRFLLKLLRKLHHADLLKSYRGSHGGFALNRLPGEISLKDVIEAIEGPIYVNPCLGNIQFCNLVTDKTECQVHLALSQIQERFLRDLARVTFADLIKYES
ncbi:RrF2 family transcriptional regulator [Heliophilum fasciatum]|uniref:BadM/Rrf2 family transcriptional regulator n=1 Tax=Heliophilum fasciatum TaxID=35700 RepID=A0A4R2RQJ8_9FIRM|nr:Rrf2 family transcriptional regulator [Heliophilum fasciatum]MCW2277672.1 Rrf2 family protein [Heliophilum fasciatum]TCP65019.1 BadM/Rrf2 family transcriptional regulator [Heliophilum fasciatum]